MQHGRGASSHGCPTADVAVAAAGLLQSVYVSSVESVFTDAAVPAEATDLTESSSLDVEEPDALIATGSEQLRLAGHPAEVEDGVMVAGEVLRVAWVHDIVSIIVTVPISSPTAIVEVPWRGQRSKRAEGLIW